MPGSEDAFQILVTELAKINKAYEAGAVKFIQRADKVDNLFASYGWNRTEFYRELSARLGIQTNTTKSTKKAKPKKKPLKVAIDIAGLPALVQLEIATAKAGDRMYAIRQYRDRTGLALTYARAVVDRYIQENDLLPL